MYRYAAKIDAAQPGIVDGLKGHGCTIQHLAKCGEGAPDILVGYGGKQRGVNVLFEIKTPGSRHSKAKPTPGSKDHNAQTALRQLEWYEHWMGPVFRVETLEDAWNLVQAEFNRKNRAA